jgi:molybdopterin adenylyltransferase
MSTAIVLTMSDSASQGTRDDRSGPEVRRLLESAGFAVSRVEVLPDERDQIEARLVEAVDVESVDLIVTTGGTGLAHRDVTPEATLAVADRNVPGMSELMRMEGLRKTPRAALSRGVVAVRGSTLIVNLPGSVRGARESLQALLPILPHALEILSEGSLNCGE